MVKSRRGLGIKALQHQDEKTKFRSVNKFPPATIGDTFRVTIPIVGEGRGDPQNILFAEVSIKYRQFYEVGDYERTVEQQFDIYPEPFIKVDEM